VLTDFLAFASPRPPEPMSFPIADVVRDVVALVRAEATERGISVEVATSAAPLAFGDADQVTQILLNLVRNGVEATPREGRVEVAISVTTEGTVAVEVRDSGPGVPAELASSFFDPYVTSKEGGTGLGLSIATLLASRQGGWVRHRASRSGGAIFELRLPLAPEEAPP
jgi:signal transduction histidine kinase